MVVCHSEPVRPGGIGDLDKNPVFPETLIHSERKKLNCKGLKFRTLDGSCSSYGYPGHDLVGSAGRPHFSYFKINSKNFNSRLFGTKDLPSARLVSNMLCTQHSNTRDERGLNEMVAFFGQFVDHTIVATTHESTRADIEIPPDDPIFRNFSGNMLPFTRSRRVKVDGTDNVERPENLLSSVVDLASVYGPSKTRNKLLRKFRRGMLKTSGANLLPLNIPKTNNAPLRNPKLFLAGDHRANEHPILLSLHTLFMREHNDIAEELSIEFPEWGDEELYQNARKINIAQMQKITFEEWYPAITGRRLPRYTGFKPKVAPSVSVIFSTAGFRVGHTLLGNQVHRVGRGGRKLTSINLMDMFFAGTGMVKRRGIDDFIRGALWNNAQKVDLKIVGALRNFLFFRTDGEDAFDLAANNLQRCRDHNCPSYVDVRRRFVKGSKGNVKRFGDITSNQGTASRMQSVYEDVNRVEAWIGLIAEDHIPGSSFGRTMRALWEVEFTRLRDGDRFHFRAPGHFPSDLMKVERVKQLLNPKFDVFRAVVLRNTDIAESELPRKMFFV